MSSDVIARVLALEKKADELIYKGHVLRAAENYGRAAEAARALGKDNLVTLCMQLQQGNLLGAYAMNVQQGNVPDATVDASALAVYRAEWFALLCGAVEALERRRVAGTLLEGKCSAAEEAWWARVLQADPRCTAAAAASLAALVGYEQFLQAGTNALNLLMNARLCVPTCSDARFQFFAEYVVHAAELMQQPRRHGDASVQFEEDFINTFRRAYLQIAAANGLDARLVQRLAGAWQRLERSGVLRARRIEESISFEPYQRNLREAMKSSLTARDLRSCALPGCGAKEAHPAHIKSCAACRTVVYCCREHQVAGWPGHKKACKAARKAAAAEDDAAGPSGA